MATTRHGWRGGLDSLGSAMDWLAKAALHWVISLTLMTKLCFEKANCSLSRNVLVYKVVTVAQASDGHTYLRGSCTSKGTFLCDNMLLAPSLPKSITSLLNHQLLKLVLGMDLCLTFLGPCHFWRGKQVELPASLSMGCWQGTAPACMSLQKQITHYTALRPRQRIFFLRWQYAECLFGATCQDSFAMHVYIALAFLMTYGSHDPWLRG